ncbi:MAG: hypothetical protein JXR73_14190 [Candidatus Omnitrophica bacterium]|nr:hypothetical protein [Candidatus Omnitrophota bacterium]
MSENNPKTVTISAQELDDLRSRLFDAEEHRKGLLQHAHNLEEMLSRKEENIAGFIQHLGNLEHLLNEKDGDLQQHRAKLKELEARCYRLEQRLNEYETDS